jgi:hypothetical protein
MASPTPTIARSVTRNIDAANPRAEIEITTVKVV